jgi:hypothetical protein
VINSKLELVQLRIPIALERVNEILQEEVTQLAGPRYARETTNRSVKRWGRQNGSVYLPDQFEETLTLHRLGLFKELGISLKTTNSLESINAQVERMTRKVTRWRNSDQRQRWLASALLEIEPRLRKIKGYRHLPQLQQALQRELKIQIPVAA